MNRESLAKTNRSGGAWLRSLLAGLLSVALAFGIGAAGARAESGPADAAPAAANPSRAQLDEALRALQASLGKIEPVSDWVAIGLARSGKSAAARYLPQAEKSLDSLRLVTDYARVALAVNANGGDVRKFGKNKIDLLSKIANYGNIGAQGPNAPAYALLALDAARYEPGVGDRWTRDALLRLLTDRRNADGGWSLAPGKSDVDVTGIVLMALSPYQDRPDVKKATDAALDWLSGVQKDNGGFGSPESSESTVQVLMALTSLGIDPGQDPRFVKNGKSALSRLMEFRLADGSFSHVPGGKSDAMSSLYALLGLTAVERFQDGLPSLYAGERTDVSVDVTVNGPYRQLAHASVSGNTALEAIVGTLRAGGISYEMERHPQYGAFLKAISGFKNGDFGGYDGWQYAVKRNGEWLANLPGMAAFVPQNGDRIVVYYGDNTALIHSVVLDPDSPREGQPVKLTVEKESYDWNAGKIVVSPAESARVTVAGQIVVTDKDGKAELKGLPQGNLTLVVDGYRQGAAPLYVALEMPLKVASYTKTVSVRVEGDRGLLAEGTARGGTALEALENFLKANNLSYEVKELSFGKYVASIGGIQAGKYGGSDGWMYAVNDGGSWIVPAEGIGTFLLEDGQELVVYYGDDSKLPEPVALTPARPKPGDKIAVAVTHRENWNSGKPGPALPLAGVKVSAGGLSAVTDAEGKATLGVLPEGAYSLTVTGYQDGKAPSAVRTATRFAVTGSYADQGKISGWALEYVRQARAAGVLKGPGDSASSFAPQAAVTRAEFMTALVRSLGLKPLSGSSFKDVPASAWYAKEIQAEAKAGLTAGVSPGRFAPDGKLTREQAAQLLARALKIKASGSVMLADEDQVSAGAKPAVQAVLEQGWMTLSDGKFLPRMTMTREQAAVVAVRLLFRPGAGKLGGN